MNPDQAPWPLNKLQQAQRSRDSLAKHSDEQTPARTDSSLEIPENQHQSETPTVSNTEDIPYEYSEVLEESEDSSQSPVVNDLDIQGEFIKHSEIQNSSSNNDLAHENDSSRLLKSILALGGIASLIIAGLIAYEHPMPKEGYQPEIPRTQDSLELDENIDATETPTVSNESMVATSTNEAIEKTDTTGSLTEEPKLSHIETSSTSELASSTPQPASSIDSEQSEAQESVNVSVASNLPSDAQQETQLIESQYQSIDRPQLEIATSTTSVNSEDKVRNFETSAAEIKALLNRAKSLYNNLQLTIPPGNNALDVYREVLAKDSDNTDAINGIKSIKEKLLDLSELAISDRDWYKARQHLDKVVLIDPDNNRALKLLESINTEELN